MIIILTILFATAGYYDKTLAIILTPIPLLIGSIPQLSLINVSFPVALSINVVAWIIALWVGGKDS